MKAMMKSPRRGSRHGAIFLAAVLAAPVLAWGQGEQALDRVTVDLEMPFPENPEAIGQILQLIEENARDIRDSAERLVEYAEQPAEFSWLTHNWRLNRIQEGLDGLHDALDDALARLDDGSLLLLAGQRSALDIIRPATSELDERVRALGRRVEEHPDWGMEYVELARAVREPADTIVEAVGLAESLTEVRNYLEDLDSDD